MKLTKEIKFARKKGIGGSEVAAVLGLSRYKSAIDVYLDKIDVREYSEEEEVLTPAWFGTEQEHIVIKAYVVKTKNKCVEPESLYVHKEYEHLLANIDAWIANKPALLEAKTTKFFNNDWGKEGTDIIPKPYLLQCAHYCAVCSHIKQIDYVDIAALGSTSEFRLYRYHRNEKLENAMIERLSDFWHNHVLKRIPPHAKDNSDLLKLLQSGQVEMIDDGKEADEEIYKKLGNLYDVKKEIKVLSTKQDTLENDIKNFIGLHSSLLDVQGRSLVTYISTENDRFDIKKLQACRPWLYKILVKKFGKKTISRRFLLK